MISIIICSVNPDFYLKVQQNIARSIGTQFEILKFDNQSAGKGICEVYNLMAEKARFPILCFLHEDIQIETINWGKKIEEIFDKDKEIGLIGLAGCKYKSRYFSGWFSNIKSLDAANYLHKYRSDNRIEKVYLSPTDDRLLQEVVCIDGVFICVRRSIWQELKFDQESLTGFHFYDIDFSLRAAHLCKVVVTYDVDLVHITSGGDYGNNWVKVAMDFHTKMKKELPYSKILVCRRMVDKSVINVTLDFLKNYDISLINKIRWITKQRLYLKPAYFYSIIKFFIYKPLHLKYFHKSHLSR